MGWEALLTKPRSLVGAELVPNSQGQGQACLPGGRGPDVYLPTPLRTAQGNGTKYELLARALRGGSPGPGGERDGQDLCGHDAAEGGTGVLLSLLDTSHPPPRLRGQGSWRLCCRRGACPPALLPPPPTAVPSPAPSCSWGGRALFCPDGSSTGAGAASAPHDSPAARPESLRTPWREAWGGGQLRGPHTALSSPGLSLPRAAAIGRERGGGCTGRGGGGASSSFSPFPRRR